jgi:hypothetical protein
VQKVIINLQDCNRPVKSILLASKYKPTQAGILMSVELVGVVVRVAGLA